MSVIVLRGVAPGVTFQMSLYKCILSTDIVSKLLCDPWAILESRAAAANLNQCDQSRSMSKKDSSQVGNLALLAKVNAGVCRLLNKISPSVS